MANLNEGANMKVTVVIPAYNAEAFIPDIVSDLQNQEERDFEVIFVNDGSTDKTGRLLMEVEQEYAEWIKVVHKENGGASSARNVGLQRAVGEYVIFLDVDDRISPHYLSYLLKNIKEFDADVAFCKYGSTFTNALKESKTQIVETLDMLRKYLYEKSKRISVCTMLTRKSLLNEHNIDFQEGYSYGEDIHFIWRVMAAASKIVDSDAVLFKYCDNENSAMTRFNEKRFDSFVLARELEPYFESVSPDFAAEYKKYGAARNLWGFLWQAAIMLSKSEFMDLQKMYAIKNELSSLKDFPDYRVRLSSRLFCFSASLYFYLVQVFKNRILHKAKA